MECSQKQWYIGAASDKEQTVFIHSISVYKPLCASGDGPITGATEMNEVLPLFSKTPESRRRNRCVSTTEK